MLLVATGSQVLFCSDNTLPPPFFFPFLVGKKLPVSFFSRKWCLESCFGISHFLSAQFFPSSPALFGERFFVLSPLYSRTLRLFYVEP